MEKTKIRIAIIDDVEDVLEIVKYNLEKEDMEVETYLDSQTAFNEIVNTAPDLVISDWMMPKPDGIQLCRLLKEDERTRNIPVMMLTCCASINDYHVALEAGADDYMVKPLRMEDLVRRIKLLMPNHREMYRFA